MAKNGKSKGHDQQQSSEIEPHNPIPEKNKYSGHLSRRNFLMGLAATGATVAFLPWGAARAQVAAQVARFSSLDLDDETMLRMYDCMLEMRWFERTLADRSVQGQTRGFVGHLYPGQEAVATGASFALEPSDYVLSNHRPHGHGLAKGVDMNKLAAELFQKATGLNGGYGGSMHFSDPSVGFLGADGVVGPGASFGTGVAHALKVRGQNQVALTYGGDGHYASPHFHSAISEAVINELPFIYLIENNQYLQYTHRRMITSLEDYTSVAQATGMPAMVVDGQDVLAVYDAVKSAVDRARSGNGPTFIEAKTYRYYNHSGTSGVTAGEIGAFGPDPLLVNMTSRPEREVRAWLAKDPLDIFQRTLIEFNLLDEGEAAARDEAARNKAEEAFRLADEAPLPKPEDGLKHVFATGTVEPWNIVS